MIGDLPATIQPDGKLPSERFANAAEVRTACQTMITADNRRATWRAAINGLIDGNVPYSRAALKAKNQGWRANVNYREAEGYINAPQSAFYDLVTEAKPCIDIDLDYGSGKDRAVWEDAIEKNYTWLLLKRFRKRLNFHLPLQQREMLVHGLGVHVWPKAYVNNWIPRTPLTGRILFPDECSLDFDEDGEYFMLRDYVPAHSLYAFIRNEGAAARLGWKPDQVWKALAQTSKTGINSNRFGSDIEELQREMKRGDIGTASRTNGIWLNYIFVKEFDSRQSISMYVVAERIDTPDYLFKRRNLFDSWPMNWFPYDVGAGTVQSLRGLGARAKDFFELSNRLKNAMADQVLLGSTIPLQQVSAVDPDKMKLMKFGMMSILPQGLQIATGFKFPDLSNGPLALEQNLKSTLRENNEAYLSGTPEPKDRETALSFQMRAQDSAQVSKSTHGLYGSNLCQFHETVLPMVVRASKMASSTNEPAYITMAKEFREKCRKDGVPDAALDHIAEIREVTSTGAGSASARIQALMTIMQYVYPDTTEDRKVNIIHDLCSALVTSSKVDRYARNLDDNEMPDSDDSFAMLENDALTNGGDAVAASRQNHVKHATSHLQKASEIVQAVQRGQMDPAQALGAIQAIGRHTAQHLKMLEGNPLRKQEYQALMKELLALSSIADQLHNQVTDAQNQPDPQEQASDKLKIGLANVHANAQIKHAKFLSDSSLKAQKQQFDTRLKFGQAAAHTRIDAVKTAAEIEHNRMALTNGSKAA